MRADLFELFASHAIIFFWLFEYFTTSLSDEWQDCCCRFHENRRISKKITEDCVALWVGYYCLEVFYFCSSFTYFSAPRLFLSNVKCLSQLLLIARII